MENSEPLVSVCMPAYNAEKYIIEAANSILLQTYRHLELIIVNDGSTDGTAEKLAKITDARLKLIHQPNQGQCSAANVAFQSSKGALIKFMDADDIISPRFIELQVARLSKRRDAIVSASWGRFYNDDLATFKLSKEDVWRNLPGDEWLVKSWRQGSSMMQCALWLIPRVILEKSGLWDETLSLINDLDFFTRVILNCNEVLFEADAVLYYRSGIPGSLSDTKSFISANSAFRSVDQATGNLLKIRADSAAKLSCANTWQQLIYTLYPQYPQLVALAEQRVSELNGADIPYVTGGWSGLLLKAFHWKTVKQIKKIINSMR
jgi:glycosyltransferase involved in cell wall biosynthesis